MSLPTQTHRRLPSALAEEGREERLGERGKSPSSRGTAGRRSEEHTRTVALAHSSHVSKDHHRTSVHEPRYYRWAACEKKGRGEEGGGREQKRNLQGEVKTSYSAMRTRWT
jgi:hypothetical protein